MNTRKDYLDGECLNSEYYGEILDDAGVEFNETMRVVKIAIKSRDQHLNDKDEHGYSLLHLWDGAASKLKNACLPHLQARGDSWSMSGGVCLTKEAARRAAVAYRSED